MGVSRWSALACAAVVLCGCPQSKLPQGGTAAVTTARATSAGAVIPRQDDAASGVFLTLSTRSFATTVSAGDRFSVSLQGTWGKTGAGTVYLQATDSAGLFVVPAPIPAPKRDAYRIVVGLPVSAPPGDHAGSLSVRACVDAQCAEVYPDTTRSIEYSLRVNAVGEWETLQRNARHDGYVPIHLEPPHYSVAWTWENPVPGELSPAVTDGGMVFVSGSPSLFALRASDGAVQWRRVFNANRLNPPSVSNGIVYAATTGHEETYLYALQASDGQQKYQSPFHTQWAEILNPTVHGGRVFVNSGYYGGMVYSFDQGAGSSAWSASGGTYGMNTPAVDDAYVYAFNGDTLDVMHATDGALHTSIGPNPGGIQEDYHGTVMLGSSDHVLAYDGTTYYGPSAKRQLIDYSVASNAVRWRSIALYTNFPAVAKGIVYATSNETYTLDALDEGTGRVLWSWRPPEQFFEFIGNVVVTDNVVFASTDQRLYAIDLRTRKTRWSAPTPGTLSISANRMLFVSSPWTYYGENARITAYAPD